MKQRQLIICLILIICVFIASCSNKIPQQKKVTNINENVIVENKNTSSQPPNNNEVQEKAGNNNQEGYTCPDGSSSEDPKSCFKGTPLNICRPPYMLASGAPYRFQPTSEPCCLDKNSNRKCDNTENNIKPNIGEGSIVYSTSFLDDFVHVDNVVINPSSIELTLNNWGSDLIIKDFKIESCDPIDLVTLKASEKKTLTFSNCNNPNEFSHSMELIVLNSQEDIHYYSGISRKI